MKRTLFGKIIILFSAALSVFLMTSCPQEISAPMVALVQDSLLPEITITSPSSGDSYYSTITIEGVISDDVIVEGDGGGSISSVSYEIANDDFRKGKINIGLDDQVSSDTDFGSGTIDFDVTTGVFSFTFSTISPSELRDLVSISITTIDRNNNEYTEELNLYENDGPYVEFGFYNDPSEYENADSRVTYTTNDGIFISGTVADSEYHKDSADELALLSWQLEGTAYSGSLDLSANSPDLLDSGTYSSLNTDGDNNFFYNPSTRRFSTYTEVDLDSGSKIITITATDLFGHETEEQETLSPPATLSLSSIDADVPYFSTVQSDVIEISSKLSDPNDLILSATDVASVYYSFTDSSGSPLFSNSFVAYDSSAEDGDYNEWYETTYGPSAATDTDDTTVYDDDYEEIEICNTFSDVDDEFFDDSGNFTINLKTSILLVIDASTNVIMKITAEDPEGNEVSKKVTIAIDDDAPVISGISTSASGGKLQNGTTYLNSGDILTLNFSVNDILAGITGIDNITEVSIDGEDVTGTISYNGGGSFTVDYPLTDANIADEAELNYSISTIDNVGNTSSTGTVTNNTLVYYHDYSGNEPSISWSSTNTSYPDWARADDTITGEITGTRVLSANSTIDIASLGDEDITSSAPYTSTSPALSGAGLGENSDITYSVYVEDAAGNSTTLTGDTLINYDGTAPNSPDTPVWEGVNIPYITLSDMAGIVTMRVDYSFGAANNGDIVELYLGSSSGTLLGTTAYNDSATSVDIEVNKTNLRPNGSKDIIARIVDPAGNYSSDTSALTVILDEDAPDISFDSAPANALNSGFTINSSGGDYTYTTSSDTAEYTWSVTDSGGAVAVTNPDSNTFNVNGSSPSISLDTSGAHADDDDYIVTLSVIDTAGNPCATVATFSFTWDTTPPTVNFDSIPANALNSGFIINSSGGDYTYTTSSDTAEYTWSVTDSGGAVTVSNSDSDTFNVNGSSPSISLDTSNPHADDDDYIVTLSVTDAAGNPCATDATFSFTWDTTMPEPPDTPVWEGANAPYITIVDMAGTVSMRVDYSSGVGDDGDTVELYLGSSSGTLLGTTAYNDSATSVDIEVNKTNLRPNGSKDIIARIVDPAGNYSSDTSALTVILDEDAPDISFDSAPANALNSGFTINSSGGDYTYTTSSDTAEYTWSVTDSGGTVAVINPDSNTFNVNGSSPSISLDTSAAHADDDDYIVTLSVIDTAGNPCATVATFSFTWDTTPPTVNFDSIPANALNSGFTINSSGGDYTYTTSSDTAEYTWSVTDSGGAVTVSNSDSDTFNVNGSSPSISLDTSNPHADDDDYIVTLSVADAAGNPCETDAFFSFTWDTTSPESPDTPVWEGANAPYITIVDMAGTVSMRVDYSSGVGDDGDTVELYLDSSSGTLLGTTAYNDSATSVDIEVNKTNLRPNGSKDIIARIVDPAGNYSSDTSALTVILDEDAPDISFDSAPANALNSGFTINSSGGDYTYTTSSDTAEYTWSVTDSGGAVTVSNSDSDTFNVNGSSPSISLDTSNPHADDDDYIVTLSVADAAGNPCTTVATFQFIWDTTAPAVTDIVITDGTTTTPYSFEATTTATDIDTYTWTISASDSSVPTLTDANTSTPELANFLQDVTYTISVTLTDFAGNTMVSAYSDTFTPLVSKAISGLAPKLSSGGTGDSSSSGSTSNSGRISTFNFDSLESAAPAATNRNYTVNTSVNRTTAATAASRTYSGSIYNEAASTIVKTTVHQGSSQPLKSDIEQPSPAAPRTYRSYMPETVSAEKPEELPSAEINNADYEPWPLEEIKRAPRTINLTALSSKASASVTGRKAVVSENSDAENKPKPVGLLPVIIMLLMGATCAVIIIRKKRFR